MPGAGRTRSLARKKGQAAYEQVVTTGQPKRSGTPCAMVLRLLRALPGVSGSLATVAAQIALHSLTPASRGQDHTA